MVLSHDKNGFAQFNMPYIGIFLRDRLQIELHPDKVSIATFASGVDFLGWVHFSRPPRVAHGDEAEDVPESC